MKLSQPVADPVPTTESTRWSLPLIAALVVVAALILANLYLMQRTEHLEAQLRDLRLSYKTELTSFQQELVRGAQQHNQTIEEFRKELEATGAQTAQVASAASRASTAAKRYSDQLAKRLASQQKSLQDQHQNLSSQLGEMKSAASQTNEKVTGIATDVSVVKTEVASTRSEMDKTLADLRSVRGDLGVQSGLIATNAKELAALRAQGDRDYFEFQLAKTKTPQRVGDVSVQLKKSDTKRNRYTIELIANDKKLEKKDKSINEPVQFYLARARVPYEIVVNEVQKDKIVGYLSAPKQRDSALR